MSSFVSYLDEQLPTRKDGSSYTPTIVTASLISPTTTSGTTPTVTSTSTASKTTETTTTTFSNSEITAAVTMAITSDGMSDLTGSHERQSPVAVETSTQTFHYRPSHRHKLTSTAVTMTRTPVTYTADGNIVTAGPSGPSVSGTPFRQQPSPWTYTGTQPADDGYHHHHHHHHHRPHHYKGIGTRNCGSLSAAMVGILGAVFL